MAQSKLICAALLVVFGIFGTQAQQPCQTVTGMANLNATQLTGLWYETVQAPAANVGCVQLNVALANNNTQLVVTKWTSSSATSNYMNQFTNATVNVTDVNANTGFNFTYTKSPAKPNNATYKILDTDYKTYVTFCSYTSATDLTTSVGGILTSTVRPNSTWVVQLVNNTAPYLVNFNVSTVANVTQNNCYASSASTTLPLLSSVFAAFYLLIRVFN
uniref:Lipocalin / cytosolic fatty-acid binding protein family n=1 Tax=Musca domestica TaxID=7370 RepID=T1PFQ1_MUSDO